MISEILAGIIGNYLTSCFVLGLLIASIQAARLPRPRPPGAVAQVFLDAYLLYTIGVGMTINFIMHAVFGDVAAESIGWSQSPFQLEVAFASLGFGVAAVVVHGRRVSLRAKTAVVLATAVFSYGAAGGHVYQMAAAGDFAPNNTGLLLVMDVVIPTVGLLFVLWCAVTDRRAARRMEEVAV